MVRWSETEKAIINDPYFQRLRRIKQLGLANLVFPGAEHTRFSHCIGTMEIAGRICTVLERKDKKNNPRLFKSRDVQLLRLAALLHDIGHLPLSHLLERVYKKIEKENTNRKATSEILGSTSPQQELYPKNHEEISAEIAMKILDKPHIKKLLKFDDISPKDVAALIRGKHRSFVLNQLMKSDLDIDQMDYMLRDGKNTGTIYSNFDLGYLVDSLEVVLTEEEESSRRILCVDITGLRAAEHYVLASYFYYTQILYHKARVIVEKIAETLYARLLEEKQYCLPKDFREINSWLHSDKFLDFDDAYVLEKFKKALKDSNLDNCTRELAKCLVERSHLPKVKFEKVQFGKYKAKEKEDYPWKLKKEDPNDSCFELYLTDDESLKLESLKKKPLEEREDPIFIVFNPQKYKKRKTKYTKVLSRKKHILPLSEFNNTLTSRLKDHTLLIERIYKLDETT